MVAYSFKTGFVDAIVAGTKRQTIRLPRKRHARPGEPVQLFMGMRTKACRKLLDPDPMCVGVDEVRIDLRELLPELADLQVNGIPILGAERDRYAIGDGFQPRPWMKLSPWEFMVRWWLTTHGGVLFTGVAIRWERRDAA